jgi:hypothetical protein
MVITASRAVIKALMLQEGNFIASIPADKEQSGTNVVSLVVSLKLATDQRSMPYWSCSGFSGSCTADSAFRVLQRIGEVQKSCTLFD